MRHVPRLHGQYIYCFFILRRLSSIRRSLTRSVFQSIVVALVLSKLNFGNATLAGLSLYQLGRLQPMMNAAARLVFSASRYLTRSCLAYMSPSALASCTRENIVQAGRTRVSVYEQSGTSISDWQSTACRRSSRSTTFSFYVVNGSCLIPQTRLRTVIHEITNFGGVSSNGRPAVWLQVKVRVAYKLYACSSVTQKTPPDHCNVVCCAICLCLTSIA